MRLEQKALVGLALALAGMGGGMAHGATVVAVDLKTTVVPSFMGMGVQWDPYDYQPTPAKWKTITERIGRMRPGYIRLCHGAGTYCRGLDREGRPEYVWETPAGERAVAMKALDKVTAILDYCQAHDVRVLMGEWGPPRNLPTADGTRIESDDPRWARIIAGYIRYLRHDRRYTCIRYYNYVNEPNGDWSGNKSYDAWAHGMRNLKTAFQAVGLDRDVRIIGPDTTGSTTWLEPFTWLDRAARDLPDVIGAYDLHWYAGDAEVRDGKIERTLAEKRRVALATDPAAKDKPIFLGESGMITGRTNGDQQPRVRTFEYGVIMADYVAQAARAGWMGATAWDLDDAMHVNQGPATPVPGPLTLKLWGFWNSQGAEMGHPEDEQPRPWFYTWTLMSRLFPRGTRIVKAADTGVPALRVLAGTDPTGRQLSLMVVNNSDEPREVTVQVPGAGARDLTTYRFFADRRPTEGDAIPVATATVPRADLEAGVPVHLPSRGVVFLTTRQSGKGYHRGTETQRRQIRRPHG